MVKGKLEDLARLCQARRVRRLAVFGSAADGRFDEARSDLDFLVEFNPLDPAEHARSYFGLLADLEALFERPVDLLEEGASRNPYFLAGVRATELTLYAA